MTASLSILHALDKNRLVTGSVVQMLEAAAGLVRRGHRVAVASRPGGDLEEACAAAGVGFVPLPFRSSFDLASVRGLRRLLRATPVDVVHVHKGRPHAAALAAATGLGPRPVVVVNRGVSFPLDRFNRLKYHHPRVGAVVCVSSAVAAVVEASGRVPRDRLEVIRGGTDVDRFDPARVAGGPLRRELGLTADEIVVGQVSVRAWKGWRELVEAFARLTATRPAARLLLVGCEPAPVLAAVAAAVADLGVADRVRLLGYRRDMPAVLAACDLVVDASWAGTGITGTLREAMAMARPVVASDVGGNRELVVDGEVGRLVPAREPAALARALGELLDDRDLRRAWGEAGRRRVVESFSTGRRLDRLEALYRRLVAATKKPPDGTGGRGDLAPQEGLEPPT